MVILQGCATRVDWGTRVGTCTIDDAIKDLGEPEKRSTRDDGSTVCEWVVQRGVINSASNTSRQGPYQDTYNPGSDEILRLTFGKDAKLAEWRYVWK